MGTSAQCLGLFSLQIMQNAKPTRILLAAFLSAAFGIAALSADVIETKNGARIVGKVTKIDGGNVTVATDFAGDITIKQSEVASIMTEAPVVVRLESGTVIQGTVTTPQANTVKISGADGEVSSPVENVAASWAPGEKDPKVVAYEASLGRWTYEASVDVTGKTGNSEQLGTSAAVRATHKTDRDTLLFYSAYDRQVSDGNKSADQFKAGVDYTNNFAGKMSWYVRDEAGFDRVKDINFYNVAAAGLGYDFIKEPKHLLTGRAGLSHRYEAYENPFIEDLSSMGLDFGLNHEWEFTNSKLVNRLTYTPSFDDFANYRFTHESYYELPLANPAWKLRLGLSNDYNSKPGPGVERLDTSYFTRLVLTWK